MENINNIYVCYVIFDAFDASNMNWTPFNSLNSVQWIERSFFYATFNVQRFMFVTAGLMYETLFAP